MANVKKREHKQKVVFEIAEFVKNSASIVFFDYRGLSVTEITELRNQLNQINSKVKVYKNTLMTRALNELEIDLGDTLVGPNAVAFSNDIVEPLKILTDYAKTHKALQLKIGIIDGEVSEKAALQKLATIPGRDALLTMLAGGMIGVVKNLAICLHLYNEQNLNNGKEG